MSRAAACLLPLLLVASPAHAEKAAAKAPAPRKPPVLKVRHQTDTLAYELTIRPGVPEAGTTVSVELELAKILETPDPTYGSRKPIDGAELRAVLVAPAKGKKRKSKAGWSDARWAVPLRDAGTYGFTFDPPTAGVYGLYFVGTAGDVGKVSWSTHLPVAVWPVDEATAKNLPSIPSKAPEPVAGNMAHGRKLCESRCRTDLTAAKPAGKAPVFLDSAFGVGRTNGQLLKEVLSDGRQLTKLEINDLLFYLRSLHLDVNEFFPDAAAYLGKQFTINEHGLKRLKESLKLELEGDAATAWVFAVFKGDDGANGAALVDYDDRVARDRLDTKNKVGYLIYLDLPKNPKGKELVLAVAKEPSYAIVAARARDAKGKMDPALNKQLKSFVGKGRFNDPRSLRKGSKSLEKKLVPVYLKAAELATMYYSDEREFTAFDSEFTD